MRCQPGDIAIILRSWFPENIGAFVTVKHAVPNDTEPTWRIESPTGLTGYVDGDPDRKPVFMQHDVIISDSDLQPIRPPGRQIDTTTQQPKLEPCNS